MLVTEIRCDDCGMVGNTEKPPGRASAFSVRARLRDEGWLCIEKNGEDLCPKCRAENRKLYGLEENDQ